MINLIAYTCLEGGGPMVVVSTAAFHARVRGSFPGLGGLKETKMLLLDIKTKFLYFLFLTWLIGRAGLLQMDVMQG